MGTNDKHIMGTNYKHIVLQEGDMVSVIVDGVWHSKIVDHIVLDPELNTHWMTFRELPELKQKKGWD